MVRIVYYDITNNKGRVKVHDYLEAQGFERIQYSVFLGKVEAARWVKIWRRLSNIFHEHCAPEDKIYSHLIEAQHFRKMLTLGTKVDIDWILQETDTFFF